MVAIRRSRGGGSQRSRFSIIHIFLTIILCALSFYAGALSGSTSSPSSAIVSCDEKKSENGALDDLKIESIVQQRVQAGRQALMSWDLKPMSLSM